MNKIIPIIPIRFLKSPFVFTFLLFYLFTFPIRPTCRVVVFQYFKDRLSFVDNAKVRTNSGPYMGFKVACSDIILLVPHCSVLFRFARCKTQKKHQNLAVLMLTVIKRIAPVISCCSTS